MLCFRHNVHAALSTKWLISSLVFLSPQLHPRAQLTVMILLYLTLCEAFALLHTVGTRQRIETSPNTRHVIWGTLNPELYFQCTIETAKVGPQQTRRRNQKSPVATWTALISLTSHEICAEDRESLIIQWQSLPGHRSFPAQTIND